MNHQKKIIITGANGNLGTATVKKFLDEGHYVIAVDNSGHHLGFAHDHDNFELHAVNLFEQKEVELFIQEMILKYEHIDAALMLAGGFAMGTVEQTTVADIQKMITLNFNSAYNVVQPLFNSMVQHGYGRLVFMGAKPAIQPTDGHQKIAYALSKSLLFTLAENINAAANGKNITATVVVPSIIDTPVNRQSMPDANFSDWVTSDTIADVLALICSDTTNDIRESVVKVYGNS